MIPFNYLLAKNLEDATNLSKLNSGAKFIAGGTNLIDLMKENIAKPATLIDINKINGISRIEEIATGGLRLGALVKNAATAYHPLVQKKYPLLSQAILAGASAQLRNMASNGGNILQRTRCYYFYDTATPCNKRNPGTGCSAIGGYNRIHAILGASENCIAVFPSDMAVGLAALDAQINVHGKDGNRTIAFADFHRLPGNTPELDNNLKSGEVITSIDLPAESFNLHYSYLKLRDRTSYAFALVSLATALAIDDGVIKQARIVLGGLAHKPWRDIRAEAFLKDKEPSAENFTIAATIILEEAKGYEHNNFKIELAKRAIVRNGLAAANLNKI